MTLHLFFQFCGVAILGFLVGVFVTSLSLRREFDAKTLARYRKWTDHERGE